jgi:ABC-type Zn uptake system ZnuABC Zn-binding protein ZnuA
MDIPIGPIDRSSGDVHAQGNPHYHLDPENEKQIARNIAEGLTRIDPANASIYNQNLIQFIKRLDGAILNWQEQLKPFVGEKIVTYHNSWPYFLKRFGLVSVGHIEPKPGIPPTTAHLIGLIEVMKREGVKIIVMEPYFSNQSPKFIADKTGAKVVVLPPSVSVGSGIKDTFAHFDRLVNTLVEALRGGH